eukprot:7255072-Pyramimonas_sp.AAC.1
MHRRVTIQGMTDNTGMQDVHSKDSCIALTFGDGGWGLDMYSDQWRWHRQHVQRANNIPSRCGPDARCDHRVLRGVFLVKNTKSQSVHTTLEGLLGCLGYPRHATARVVPLAGDTSCSTC